jgi:S-(hydroxymethyl)glutathione dehydrogenase/alcohol dehydrogenase
MKAAVFYGVGEPLRIEDLEIPKPQQGEVLVKVAATGMCSTDAAVLSGAMPVPPPIVLGHESAGIVEEIGPGVTTVKPGDHVVMFVMPSCGKCSCCISGQPYLCKPASEVIMAGTMMDGTTRLSKPEGEVVHSYFSQGSFAEYAVVHELAAVKIPDDVPLEKACILGCGTSTGLGAVLNKAVVGVGSTVAVLGCGGVGQSVVIGAKLAGSSRIFAVDVLDSKLEMARELGATDVINASRENVLDRIQDGTNGGVDYAFECIGNPATITLSLDCIRPGGKAIVLGMAPYGTMAEIDAAFLLFDKTLTGCVGGSLRPGVDIPRYAELYREGRLPLDKLVSKTYKLDEINEAFSAMKKGEVIRGVICF